MAKKSTRDAAARAEARRRARLAAQGRLDDEEAGDETDARPAPSPARGNFLKLIFPPAAPLANKPDPLLGFTYAGRWRPVVANLWLIMRNPIAGLGMGVVWAVAWAATTAYTGSTIGTVSSLVSFGSLVAAGVIGWQRPWLYGLTAAIFGYLIYAAYVTIGLSGELATSDLSGTLAQYLLINGTLQAFIGAAAGFYGGYLRRRFADPTLRQQQQARRKR